MKNWKETLVAPTATLFEALAAINRSACQIALVIDEDMRLIGTLSDGDARRAILSGHALDQPIHDAANPSPTCARPGDRPSDLLRLMRDRGLHQIPVLEESGIVVGLATIDELLHATSRPEEVVIMVGGFGRRLRDLTRNVPKPMLSVGGRPILETILTNFRAQGFKRFWFAVHFKAEIVEAHFGDGSKWGVEIRYLREEEPLGTAGALGLLPHVPERPLILTNGDLLTTVDYTHLVDRHIASGCDATMAVRDYEVQVPFGVIKDVDGAIETIEEKPVYHSTVNAGIYVLSPSVLGLIPKRERMDVTTLFELAIESGLRARSHRIDGYWRDIGRVDDFQRANTDYDEVFP
ncbi:D-glycero-alpha-D-manno-heptose 1-phosphate guanylyltransferase [Planctomycetes bacterium Poly30]|uniref:D-glycero-alpha-D-manno-heptose 1-phosphate guanylyltransferase n=1 Tax=Saltatorellus ferox TaxID=2528018 RepID=A0A518EX64_9BACT|nr:D-glycero-alpha-D-manno-heptose 1-phosphate guanylyltransferase [Planctomycetes bacterium Poly30]